MPRLFLYHFRDMILLATTFYLASCVQSDDLQAESFSEKGPALAMSIVPPSYKDTIVVSGLMQPTLLNIAPDGRIFVSEKPGRLRVIKNGTLLPTPFSTLNATTNGDGGLLGIAFDPEFAANGHVYVYYTTGGIRHNRISRITASTSNPDVMEPGSEWVVLDLPSAPGTIHNAGSLQFGLDGKLYISVGDLDSRTNSQDLNNPFGKILRINKDGSIPGDNPFLNITTGVNQAIYSYGFRNPFSFSVQPVSGRIFVNDPGRDNWAGEGSGYEEINELFPGKNYGWPLSEGYVDTAGYQAPLHAHPTYDFGCAITGGDFYNPMNPKFPMTLFGKYFFADYCGGTLRYLDPMTNAVTAFASSANRPTGLKTGFDGVVYYLEYNAGLLRKITFNNPPLILEAESATSIGTGTSSLEPGFTGTGYMQKPAGNAGWIEFSGTSLSATSIHLTLRYANGSNAEMLVSVSLNGTVIAASLPLPSTGSWSTWGQVSGTVQLQSGLNTLRISMSASQPLSIDHLRVE
jgi:glucose/arabinose dehydrogenase